MFKRFIEEDPAILITIIADSTKCFQDAVSIAQTEEEPVAAARKLTETAFTRGSADNITCIVVKIHHEEMNPTKTDQDLEVETQTISSEEEESHPTSKEEPEEKTKNS